MPRPLCAGDPEAGDFEMYELVAGAQAAAIATIEAAVEAGGPLPSGRAVDAVARDLIGAAGHADHFGHGTGHGIGLATHEAPTPGQRASDEPLPSPTAFSGEPRINLEG